MVNYGKPLRQVFDVDDRTFTGDDVFQRLRALYPNEKWSREVLGRRLFKYSVNHPSLKHRPDIQRRSFIFWMGGDQFRKWNPTRDGNWTWVDGEMTQDVGEADEEALGNEEELPAAESPFSIEFEKDLESFLVKKLDMIEPGLTLFAKDGIAGRQYKAGAVGFIDLLALDKQNNFVVIELKVGEARDRVCGQLLRYMGWVKANLANDKQVRGIIVASDFSEGTRYAIQATQGAQLKKYEVQFKFTEVPRAGKN